MRWGDVCGMEIVFHRLNGIPQYACQPAPPGLSADPDAMTTLVPRQAAVGLAVVDTQGHGFFVVDQRVFMAKHAYDLGKCMPCDTIAACFLYEPLDSGPTRVGIFDLLRLEGVEWQDAPPLSRIEHLHGAFSPSPLPIALHWAGFERVCLEFDTSQAPFEVEGAMRLPLSSKSPALRLLVAF